MNKTIKRFAAKLPGIRKLVAQRDALVSEREQLVSEREQLKSELNQLAGELSEIKTNQGFVPPGHFYSPIPSFKDIRDEESRIFGGVQKEIDGINLDGREQLKLLESMLVYYGEMPFKSDKQDDLRYYYENPAYSYSDAIFLHGMIRKLEPRQIIEVGSGFSSCMMLDTNELFFENSIETTFIEPYPELLLSLIKKSDKENIRILPARLQDVDIQEFDVLEANDILFIDSTHVSKIDSDVNRILFEILPRLSPGVYIHFHDIFYPFEYPKEWVYEGRAWNEAYILRAFLQFNPEFHPVLMSSYMHHFHQSFFKQKMPLCLNDPGGNIWLRKK